MSHNNCGSRTYCETSLFNCWVKYGVGYFRKTGKLPSVNDLHAHVKDKSYKETTLYQTYRKVKPHLRKYKQEHEKWVMVENDHDGWTITLSDLCVWEAKWTKTEIDWDIWTTSKEVVDKPVPCYLTRTEFRASSYSELMSRMMKANRVIFERSSGKVSQ